MATKDPYEQVKEIYRLKGIYDGYLKSGDTANMEKTKNEAQPYYQQLINNGYANVADDLSKSNYTNAKSIYDKYVSSVKPQANVPSVPSSQNSLNQEQINNLLSTGTTTGTGTQKSLNDNSFWNQYNQYVDQNRSKADEIFGMIAGNNDAAGQTTTNRVNDLWGTITSDKANLTADYDKLKDFNYSNPFETETGKSVLERYDLAALQGRDNQAALGGANNSGNIDSYSAANALRQQASLRNLGEQSALAAHDRTVNSGRGILSDQSNYYSDLYNRLTGLIDTEANAASSRNQDLLQLIKQGYTDPTQQYYENGDATLSRLYNQGETTKLNDHYITQDTQNQMMNRYGQQADITGQIPIELRLKDNPYVNTDGTLKNPNIDYQGLLNAIDTKLQTTTDPVERAALLKQKVDINDARGIKQGDVNVSNLYGQNWFSSYAPTSTVSQQNTELAVNQSNTAKAFALQEKELDANIDYNKASLEWQKEAYKLEMDYKTKGLTQEAVNFAMGIERDRYIAELNTSVSMDSNNVQREINASNERIAKIQASTSNYAVNSNAQTALKELESKEKMFNAELTQRATEFNASVGTEGVSKTNISSTDNSSEDWYGINMDSVKKLGRGNITQQELDRLIESGEVIAEMKNGEIYVQNAK